MTGLNGSDTETTPSKIRRVRRGEMGWKAAGSSGTGGARAAGLTTGKSNCGLRCVGVGLGPVGVGTPGLSTAPCSPGFFSVALSGLPWGIDSFGTEGRFELPGARSRVGGMIATATRSVRAGGSEGWAG